MVKTLSLEERAEQAAGNHLKFESFAWFERPEESENWYIIYTSNRDSGLISRSNEKVWRQEMKPFIELGDVRAESHNHWACGFVDGFAVRVFYADGTITDAFKKVLELEDRIENYPILDEDDLSEMEFHATQANIEEAARCYANRNNIELPEDWLDKLHENLWSKDIIESDFDGGWWPKDEILAEAFAELNFKP